ncbi:MAG: prolipoprotein diacylglyceryl transferase [Opitutaceae bacterium]
MRARSGWRGWSIFPRALAASTNTDAIAAPQTWIAGKTIVGGILGGWLGLEIAKKPLRVRQSTGDLFVLPLAAGIAIGRIGCFLAGFEDGTCGTRTTLPWGIDFGDGLARHPTQLYELLFVAVTGLVFHSVFRDDRGDGRAFRAFVGAYLLFRLAVEFIKPIPPHAAGLSAIQWVSLIGATMCAISYCRIARLASSGVRDHG